MGTKAFFTRGWPTRLSFYLGKSLPPGGGRFLAATMARLAMMIKPDLYWSARANLRHVLGDGGSEQDLDRRLYRLFFNAARGYYELFHNVGREEPDLSRFDPPVYLTEEARHYATEALNSGRGAFVIGCHTGNFDLAIVAFAQYLSVPPQFLSLADPPPGFELFNRLRQKTGALLTPISPETLRQAMRRLHEGGVVVTGVDRPTGDGDEPVEFFGATAYLPTGYIRLPIRTRSLVITLATFYEDGAYWIHANPPMEMVRTGDRQRDMEVNLRRVLDDIEAFIRSHPEQWMMFMPVWR